MLPRGDRGCSPRYPPAVTTRPLPSDITRPSRGLLRPLFLNKGGEKLRRHLGLFLFCFVCVFCKHAYEAEASRAVPHLRGAARQPGRASAAAAFLLPCGPCGAPALISDPQNTGARWDRRADRVGSR